MAKTNTNQSIPNVPELRFRGFSDEWEAKSFGSVYSFLRTNSLSRAELRSTGEIKNIHYGDIHMRLATNFDSNQEVLSYAPAQTGSDFVTEGDLVIADASEDRLDVGKSIEIIRTNNDKIISGLHTFLARPHINTVALGFAAYFMQSYRVRRQMMRIANGASVLGISKTELSKIIIILPSLQEQVKIAKFITAVVDKISALQSKKAALQKYKSGVMQQIFSQQIRFMDENGKEYPEWGEKKMGEIGQTYNGLQGKSGDDFGEGSPYITYKQIFAKSTLDASMSEYVKVADDENQNTAKKGDVFFTTSSETPNEVGFSSVLLKDVPKLYLNSFCFGYRINNLKEFLPEFAQFIFRSKHFRRNVVRLAQGSTRYNISKISLMKTEIKLPRNEEQQKIADFLTSLDNNINLIQKALEQAEQFKKALLQGMFV